MLKCPPDAKKYTRISLGCLTMQSARPPLNLETPSARLNSKLTPNKDFFRRSHFEVPSVDPRTWTLAINGDVERPALLSLSDLKKMPQRELAVTLECAGDGRSGFKEVAAGEVRWGVGAVGTAVWTGVPLRNLIGGCGIKPGANQVIAEGEDERAEEDPGQPRTFIRGLTLEKAMDPSTIVALTMNSEPLPSEHGFPARLIVPGWYAVASVKWLRSIRVISGEPFKGHFNATKYTYVTDDRVVPVTEMRVKSLVLSPLDGESLQVNQSTTIRGKAWSGSGTIKTVRLTIGEAIMDADLDRSMGRYAWTPWSLRWTPTQTGEVTISASATDDAGNTQPLVPFQNKNQYGYNAVQTLRVRIEKAGRP